MIFKEAGSYKIHRLRVIHIYEADFNLLLASCRSRRTHPCRTMWRQTGLRGTIAHLFRGTQIRHLICEPKNNIQFRQRYDELLRSDHSRFGIPRQPEVWATSNNCCSPREDFEAARYKLRTAKGISDLEYFHCPAFPLYGSGQGAGNSPSIWLFISSTLFDLQDEQAHGASFSTPGGTQQVRLTMVGFVDDSTGTCNDFQPTGKCFLDTLAKRMQHDAQLWNDLLFCSGGRLELGKCSLHVLHFCFKADGTPVPLLKSFYHDISVRDSITGDRIPIPAKHATDAHKTLGNYKAPADCHQKQQLHALTSTAKRLSILLSKSPINRAGSKLAYH